VKIPEASDLEERCRRNPSIM